MSENRSLQSATVYSEDETYNILRRTPIQDLDAEYRERIWEFYGEDKVFAEWLERHGWTKDKFLKAGSEYEQSLKKRHS